MATPADFSMFLSPLVAFYYDRDGNEISRDDFKAAYGVDRSQYRRMAYDAGLFRFVAIWPVEAVDGGEAAETTETDGEPSEI